MDRFVIDGGKRLSGSVTISGAKNATLPVIAAALLTDKKVVIENVPDVVDVHTMLSLVKYLGTEVEFSRGTITMHTPRVKRVDAPYEIVRKMRASYYVMGALLAREKRARVSLPGGCAIGPRPIDLHIKGFEKLGIGIEIEQGYVNARARSLRGAHMSLQGPKGTSVGATINVMLAATQASGMTEINSAACEPEVVDVANFLRQLGIDITGAGTSKISIYGGGCPGQANHRVIPDRIEAGTFAVAAAISGGRIAIRKCDPEHLTAVIDRLEESGARVRKERDHVVVTGAGSVKPTNVFVAPYPGFPTDMQAQFMALNSIADGTSVMTETIFENRFMHVQELKRLNADIQVEGNTAIVHGIPQLDGASVMATDLRASACLIIAGLVAQGETIIDRIYHLDRGYERIERKLAQAGAQIKRIN